MASKFLTGLVASAMLVAPTTAAFAQASSPAPASESVSDSNELRSGRGLAFGAVFFVVLGLLIVFQDDIFGDDDVEPISA
jgi:hypothetical protein